jgi:hypothetical protein
MNKPRRGAHNRDPIFVLIDAHTKALRAAERAERLLDALEARIDARPSERRKSQHERLTKPLPGGLASTDGCTKSRHQQKARKRRDRISRHAIAPGI